MGSEAFAVQVGNGEVKPVKLEESGATMGSEADAVQLGNGEVKPVKLEESGVDMEAKKVVKHSSPSKMPVSPDAHEDAGSPCTPKKSFDPFAPGSGELMMAPQGSKYSKEARSRSARSLNFCSSVRLAMEEYCESDEENALEEQRLLEFLYNDLLKVIVSTQVSSVQHDMCLDDVLVKHVTLDAFKTPEPVFPLIADTCPPAPVKFGRKSMITDRGLCRKLDF